MEAIVIDQQMMSTETGCIVVAQRDKMFVKGGEDAQATRISRDAVAL